MNSGTRRRLLKSLPISLSMAASIAILPGLATAQDAGTTVVPKSASRATAAGYLPSSASQTDAGPALRPAQDVETTQSLRSPLPEPPVETSQASREINSDNVDEGAGWEAAVQSAPGPTPLVGEARDEAINSINSYFNTMTSIQGSFKQVDAESKETTGRFYVQRPGKLRFDYEPPSPLRIVSDGHFLAIEDSDLKTIEKYPLESTPFKLLLAGEVDLERDAHILGVDRNGEMLSVSLRDRKGDTGGSIKLVFDTASEMELSQWVITDAQGLETTVYLDQVRPGRKVAADFFQAKQSFNPFQ